MNRNFSRQPKIAPFIISHFFPEEIPCLSYIFSPLYKLYNPIKKYSLYYELSIFYNILKIREQLCTMNFMNEIFVLAVFVLEK